MPPSLPPWSLFHHPPPHQGAPTDLRKAASLLRGVVSATMQWLADARLVVGFAPTRSGPTPAAALGLIRKEHRGMEGPVAAHLPFAPELDPGAPERRFVRGPEALAALVEAGDNLFPASLQQEFLECFSFVDWSSRVSRVCVLHVRAPLRVACACCMRVCMCVCACACCMCVLHGCVHVRVPLRVRSRVHTLGWFGRLALRVVGAGEEHRGGWGTPV